MASVNKINIDEFIGKKFGKLTITKIWRDTEKKEIKCIAKCDECQQEKEFRFRSIRDGEIKSCGCKHKKINLEELIGQKFNRLTIIKAVREKRGKDTNEQIYVQCQCDCGSIIECRLSALKNNTIQSCGCLHREIVSVNLDDLIGQKYGKLTIINAWRNKYSEICVKVKCECGNEEQKRYRYLTAEKEQVCNKCKLKNIKKQNTKELEKLIGQKYGKLTILDAWRNDKSEIRVKAKCECGNEKEIRYRNLTSGETKTCGKCTLIDLDSLIGQKYGKLTIIKARRENRRIYVEAQCECNGNIKEYTYTCLKTGHTTSCGCNVRTANGNSKKRLYQIWKHMQERCYNEKNSRYYDWGGRGIRVCDEWLNSFEAFETWTLANGYQDDLTIDRINNNGNYEPNNCRWTTMKIQNNNKRNTLKNSIISIDGEDRTVIEWCKQNNISYGTFKSRRQKGASMEEAVAPSKINRTKEIKK